MSTHPGSPDLGGAPLGQPGSQTQWRRVEALFHRAAEVPTEEREAMLRAWCTGEDGAFDTGLYAEVISLLESDLSVEQMLAGGAGENAPLLEASPWVGRVLGHYRLARELGQGGMGIVYLGEREQGPEQAGLHARVAVKVLRQTLADSPARGHFLLERDALARLGHPNIARLLDGGVTEEGAPFLVMEYVAGRRLDQVCDAPEMTPQGVAGLMLQLCGAVGYVHRNLILHRDLKPGNVMVTDEGVVKLLDFGTLKLLESGTISEMTQAGMRPLTLRYASPEHILGERVTTASDVYSLGVTLYRLLAGRFPEARGTEPNANSSGSGGTGMTKYLANLRDAKVLPPSALAGGHLKGELSLDLDAIAMKAMRYEPGERYQTADALAAELVRALEGHAVQAREGDARYRAVKFYGRHRGAIWAGVAAALVLALGAVGMARETRVVRAEEARAEAGVEQERLLAHGLLFDYFIELQQIPGSTEAQRKAVSEAVQYLDGLTATAPSKAVTMETVRAYTAMGTLLGSPYWQNLGDVPGALRTLEKARVPARELVRTSPGDSEAIKAQAGVQMALAQVFMGSGQPKAALAELEPASEAILQLAHRPDADAKTVSLAATVLGLMGDDYSMRGNATLRNPAKATAIYEEIERLDQRALKLQPGSPKITRGLALVYTKLGQLAEDKDGEVSQAYYHKGLAVLDGMKPEDRAKGPVVRTYSILRQSLTLVDLYTGHRAEAEALVPAEEAEAVDAVTADPVDARARFDMAAVYSSLSDAYLYLKDNRAALLWTGKYLDTARVLVRLEPKNVSYQYVYAYAVYRHGKALAGTGAAEAGMQECRNALALLLPMAAQPDAEPDVLGATAGVLVYVARDPAQDGPLAVSLMRRAMAAGGEPSSDQWMGLAEAQQFAGDPAGARGSVARALEMLDKTPKGLGHAGDIVSARKLQAELK